MEEYNFLSAFLELLGSAILNSFWQFGVLWILASLINSTFKLTSGNKYRVAITLQLLGFALFLQSIFFFSPAWYLQNTVAWFQQFLPLNEVNYAMANQFSLSLIVCGMVYLFALFYKIVLFLRGVHQIGLIRNKGLHKIDVEWRLFLQKACVTLSIKKPVKICISTLVESPLTVGFLKPLILVPAACINQLSLKQMEAVILHEAAHIKRLDYLVNMMQRVIDLVLFFNPFNTLLSKMVSLERENSCDDLVLRFKYNAIEYADALLKIAQTTYSPKFVMGFAGNTEGQLLQRVRRMIKPNRQLPVIHFVMPVFFVFILLVGLVKFNGFITNPSAENLNPTAWKQGVSLMDHYFMRSSEMGLFNLERKNLNDHLNSKNVNKLSQELIAGKHSITVSKSADNIPLKTKPPKAIEKLVRKSTVPTEKSKILQTDGKLKADEIPNAVALNMPEPETIPTRDELKRVTVTSQLNENISSLFSNANILTPVISFVETENSDAIFSEDETVVSMVINEEKSSSYRKKIIVTTIDANNQTHTFTLTVDFYQ